MFDDTESEARLGRLFAATSQRRARPDNARELEGRLLDAFDQRYPRKERYRRMSLTTRRALILCAAAGLLCAAACAAPVDLDVEVGRTLAIHYQADGHPAPQEIASFLQSTLGGEEKATRSAGEHARREVGLRVQKEAGAVAIEAEIWGNGPPPGALADRVKAAFPALADAQIKEELLHGKVHSNLAKKLGRDMLDLDVIDSKDVETARRQVMAQLRAQGIDGKVDVQIEDGDGHRRVQIKVERECPDGGGGGAPPEVP